MITIKINGITVPFIKEDLKTKIPNNSFTKSFAVPHSSYPIRIIESKATQDALGPFTLDSNKRRYFSCIISVDNSLYNAEIEQISRIGRFRKCNITYKNPLTSILEKPIASYMIPINLLGNDPIENPYTEESETQHNAFTEWRAIARENVSFRFPSVLWQMATVNYPDYLTEEGEEVEPAHVYYQKKFNYRASNGDLIKNFALQDTDHVDVSNYNIYQPQVFVLSPILKALQAANYTLKGSFTTSAFAKSMLFSSNNHNMTEVTVGVTGVEKTFDGVPFAHDLIITPEFSFPGVATYFKKIIHTTTSVGEFKVRFDFDVQHQGLYGFFAKWQGEMIEGFFGVPPHTFEGDLRFEVFTPEVGDNLELYYWHTGGVAPASHTIEVVKDIDDLTFLDAHPTIDFSRYMPDWNVSELINQLKNTLNLKIDIDEISQTLYLNKNESDYLIGGEATTLTNPLNIADFENIESESYYLKFENAQDTAVLATKNGFDFEAKPNEKTVIIDNKFKMVPYSITHDFSRALAEKEGIGLMLYNPTLGPRTVNEVDGQTLVFEGENGILAHNWRSWLRFRLNSGRPKASGPFTKTQLEKIEATKKIWIENTLFLVSEIEYKETNTGFLWVELQLESVTY